MRQPMSGFTLIETMVALAVLLIVMGTIITCVTNIMAFGRSADNNMLVITENQHGIRELKTDIYCSSRNTVGMYSPRLIDGELRMMVVTGFDKTVAFASLWSGYSVCYKHDSTNNMLVRLFRDAMGVQIDAPAEYPGSREQVVSNYCTSVSYTVEPNVGMVTVTLINAIGSDPNSKEYAVCENEFTVIPFNTD